MSDEAFARRFYSDRAELSGLGVPLHSQRDEFTGEELYTLRPDQYFLPPLELSDDELAALQTCLYLLEGKFAYAEPLRLALQNLALGRARLLGSPERRRGAASRSATPTTPPRCPGRLSKLESAISKQRTVKFRYWSISRDEESERTLNPYALLNDNGAWYVVGHDLERDDIRTFRVSRIRGEIRFATRRERDFRTPTDFDIDKYRARPPWQIGDLVGEARIEVAGDTAWWVRAGLRRERAESRTASSSRRTRAFAARFMGGPSGRTGDSGRAGRAEAESSRKVCVRSATGTPGSRLEPAAKRRRPSTTAPASASAGPVAPERFAVLQSLLAYLLEALRRREASAIIDASRAGRAVPHPGGRAPGASFASQSRQFRRRLLRGVRRARRRQGAGGQGAVG